MNIQISQCTLFHQLFCRKAVCLEARKEVVMKQLQFDTMSDEEILLCIKREDTVALDYILEKYKNLVRHKARTLYLIGADKEDLIQEGMIGLYKAVRDFDASKQASFFTFANLCISRQMYNAIKASNRKKNIPLNTYISLNAAEFATNQQDFKNELDAGMLLDDNLNPEKLVIDKESISMIEYELGRCLSVFEQKVFDLYTQGIGYVEIARQLGKTDKSIDNALRRIKKKLSLILEDMEK